MRKCFQNDTKTRSKIHDKSMNFQNLRFLVFCEEYNVKIVFLHDQGSQQGIKNLLKTMQLQCSKKVCKKHETCSEKDPKWEPKSTQILKKTRFKNVLVFGINFRRPLVPKMLAKWSPTRRTSSRKPNRKGKLQGKGTPRTVFESQRARGAGGTPGPERIFEYRSAM